MLNWRKIRPAFLIKYILTVRWPCCKYFVATKRSSLTCINTGTLMLTDCIDLCRRNVSCKAANFETGLCVLFGTSAEELPGVWHLVFTKFNYFLPNYFTKTNYVLFNNSKSVVGLLGIRTWGCSMVGADETTELWRPPGFLITRCYLFLSIDTMSMNSVANLIKPLWS